MNDRPPVINIDVPKQPRPVINIDVPRNLPPVVNVNVPQQPAPIVKVESSPKAKSWTFQVERDRDGRISTVIAKPIYEGTTFTRGESV